MSEAPKFKAFYHVASTESGYKTLDEAVKHARSQASRYGSNYTVFQAVKTFEAEPRFYSSEHDLSFGHEASA